tara:strand:- start:132 stop:485 length:354 start_codon:yes stop_codon:yes gene_type:complete
MTKVKSEEKVSERVLQLKRASQRRTRLGLPRSIRNGERGFLLVCEIEIRRGRHWRGRALPSGGSEVSRELKKLTASTEGRYRAETQNRTGLEKPPSLQSGAGDIHDEQPSPKLLRIS